jgi:hypothetical protein
MKKDKELKLTGTVVPGDWDERANVIGVAIRTWKGQEYLVDRNKLGKELLALLEKTIEVMGTVREHEDGYMVVNVKKYEVTRKYPEDVEPY